MKEKVLITGANGFIGSRLSELVSDSGFEVVKLKHEYLNMPDMLDKVISETRPTVVYHLAAYGNQYHQKDWNKVVMANYLGTYNLLWSTRETDLSAFVNTGSSSEYGTKTGPMSETDLPETQTIYGATKVGATYLTRAFANEFALPVVNVRPFSVYGPMESDSRFIPTVIRCALKGEVLNLSEGVHDWIYIDDFVKGMLMVSENAKHLRGEVVNIGSGIQTTNTQIVDMISKLTGKSIEVNCVDKLRNFDTTLSWVADNTKLRSLGWIPQETLESGLARTIYEKRTN